MKQNIKNLKSFGKIKIKKKKTPDIGANPYFVVTNEPEINIDKHSSDSETLPRVSLRPTTINSPLNRDEHSARLLTMQSLDK